ncbi:hypothetical protein AVEN_45456-1 [Araneus ventricosus]|uniref:Uncharacterized protein n=1 Tax=Araneus ventricosus TaxID=182803 RepID=A0A4Y2L1W2_ARAVE|nr:hypothetical protein AVEN_45456-1 [Araneus ventricosus]
MRQHKRTKPPRYTSGRAFDTDGFGRHQAHVHRGSSVKWGFELGTLWPRNPDLTTRSPPLVSYERYLWGFELGTLWPRNPDLTTWSPPLVSYERNLLCFSFSIPIQKLFS